MFYYSNAVKTQSLRVTNRTGLIKEYVKKPRVKSKMSRFDQTRRKIEATSQIYQTITQESMQKPYGDIIETCIQVIEQTALIKIKSKCAPLIYCNGWIALMQTNSSFVGRIPSIDEEEKRKSVMGSLDIYEENY